MLRIPDSPDVVSPAATAVLLATVVLHDRQGRATMREIAAATGLRSTGSVLGHLRNLRARHLVSWEPSGAGTLHPTVAQVPIRA